MILIWRSETKSQRNGLWKSRKRKDGWLSAYLRRERPVRVDRHGHVARAVRRVARLLRRAHRNGQLRRGVEVDAGGGDGAVDAVVAELRRVQRQRVDVLRTGKQRSRFS